MTLKIEIVRGIQRLVKAHRAPDYRRLSGIEQRLKYYAQHNGAPWQPELWLGRALSPAEKKSVQRAVLALEADDILVVDRSDSGRAVGVALVKPVR